MAIYKIKKGDRDCSASVIDCYKTAGIPVGGASYTGNMRSCLLSTGVWSWLPVSVAKKRGDLVIKEGSHVAMMKNATQLMEFSHDENWNYYNGKVGDQLNNSGSSAESHTRSYYSYPWNGVLRYVGKETDKVEIAAQLMEHLVSCPLHGYTMSSPGRTGSSGYCEVNINVGTGGQSQPIEKDTGIVFTYRVKAGGMWLPEVKNLDDYAGIRGKAITDIAIKVNKGSVWYQVHTYRGNWLGKVNGYNINDIKNGYAGNGKPIDAVRVYYTTPSGIALSQATYRVSALGQAYYPWQTDTDKNKQMDGYAGEFGMVMDRFQIYPTTC